METGIQAPLIQLNHIVKRYGSFAALDDVCLGIYPGEFLALLGPSGCGKTTLLRTIAGFCEPTSGDVLMDGRSMLKDPPNRRPVNTVFQNYALFPHLTIEENVAFGPRRHGAEKHALRDRVRDALTMVSMAAFIDRYPAELSGGQQQRVALARAIINQPKVLLLDEPLAALDLKLRKHMQLELKHLQVELGITFVIVTHDQEEAMVMADRIVVMSSGRIEQVGTGDSIYASPQSRFVADFIGDANLIDCKADAAGQLRTAQGDVALPYAIPDGKAVTTATLMIRPERIGIGSRCGSDAHVCAEGIVRDVVHAGPVTRVYVDSNGIGEIVIACNNATELTRVSPLESLAFYWLRSDAEVLTR
ncbi:ABC transporter ATP-binding protein [Paraburkholderia sp. IW21]|uniref:ABC transporter ATP-binding protein n=1 Tax=Paraburkholderia sp. IW21 TaxID=3242488 RepID=UPI0035204D7A